MASAYYKPCKEFDICNELIEKHEVIPALGHDKAPYGASFSCNMHGRRLGCRCALHKM